MVTGLSPDKVRIDAVVVGASAGAIDVLNVLLPALPAAIRASVVVLVHIPPHQPSLLVELFAPRCAPRVAEVQDKEAVGAGKIWFAPPNYHVLIERERSFALSLDEPVHFSRPSIDVLFESAADAYGENLLALVLTGASRDGCSGAVHVQRRGGLLFVQTPETAEAPLLPRLTIAEAKPNLVANVDQLAAMLVQLIGEQTP
ncbi:MAG TPA: chemotaxis protein CheB [Polyangiales bacterium]|nr:chemotaxis protein CheB [Polyangiales bacterium]